MVAENKEVTHTCIYYLLNRFLSGIYYYQIKRKLKQYCFIINLVRSDNKKKKQIKKRILARKDPIAFGNNNVIVSLTSYGKRVQNTLPYTLSSLIDQDEMPKGISVYLSEDEYNCVAELPAILKKYYDLGINFQFVEDLRSYKKFYFAFQEFPDNAILTVDDDMYYHKQFIKVFCDEYRLSNKRTVLGTRGRYEVLDIDGNYLPYSKWIDQNCIKLDDSKISFYGYGGCLYPQHIFDAEVSNRKVFMQLAPFADDLWLWIMEKRQNIDKKLISIQNDQFIEVNRKDMYILRGSLTYINEIKNLNDIQLQQLINYYNITHQ